MIEKTIALIGLSGVGKTTLGEKLARHFEVPFMDSDVQIEVKSGRVIKDIFAQEGESTFRKMETEIIAESLTKPPHILSLGGGAFIQGKNRHMLRGQALSIWLKASPEVLMTRLEGQMAHRPLFAGKDPKVVLAAQISDRYPIYEEADLVLECATEPEDATLNRLILLIEKARPCPQPLRSV